jgi:hypothetical protein
MSETNKGNFPDTVASLWENNNKLFPFRSMTIDAKSFDSITAALSKVEIGGQIRIKRNLKKNSEKSPGAYLEYLSPAQVAEDRRRNEEYKRKKQMDESDVI